MMCLAAQGVQQQYNTSISLLCELLFLSGAPFQLLLHLKNKLILSLHMCIVLLPCEATLCTLSLNLCSLHSFGGPSNTIVILNIGLLFCISVFIFLEEDSFFLYPLKQGLKFLSSLSALLSLRRSATEENYKKVWQRWLTFSSPLHLHGYCILCFLVIHTFCTWVRITGSTLPSLLSVL